MAEEWSDWIEHDGKGCPCVGRYVQAVAARPIMPGRHHPRWTLLSDGSVVGFAAHGRSWNWETGWNPTIRYRIRKPKGLTILEKLVAEPERELTE